MDDAVQGKGHKRLLILLVVIGLLLIFGILRMLYSSSGRGAAPVDQHPQQTVQ